ncbi:hypothetical protein CHH27_04245 [Labrenzia sp. VG12]|nr:hypothetical protein CHH27_04245 [Labrenzia sp. VG12]
MAPDIDLDILARPAGLGEGCMDRKRRARKPKSAHLAANDRLRDGNMRKQIGARGVNGPCYDFPEGQHLLPDSVSSPDRRGPS